MEEKLVLGNLDAKRDWGHAKDYVKVMWLILQQDEPDDYVIGMGTAHSVREFAQIAFYFIGLDYEDYVESHPRYYRHTEINTLVADPTKAKTKLNWKYNISLRNLVKEIVNNDLEILRNKTKLNTMCDPK